MSQQQPYDLFEPDGSSGLTEAQMLAYLEGRLSEAETRRVEKILSEEGMDSDAAEGLMNLPIAETREMVNQLNQKMQRQLKSRRVRRRADTQLWTWVTVFLILILIALGYYLIKLIS